jgi:hypothetical protein
MTQAQVQGFDIDNMNNVDVVQATHKVGVVFNDDGEPVSGFLIVGKNSPQYQEANNSVRAENIKRAAKRNKQVDASTDEGAKIISRTVMSNEKTIVSAVVVDWFGFLKGGEPLSFDKAVVDKMLTAFPTWQTAISAALENDANFMKV